MGPSSWEIALSIVEAFEHTRKALLASSVREVADQSNVYHLLSAEGCRASWPRPPAGRMAMRAALFGSCSN